MKNPIHLWLVAGDETMEFDMLDELILVGPFESLSGDPWDITLRMNEDGVALLRGHSVMIAFASHEIPVGWYPAFSSYVPSEDSWSLS